MAISLSKVSFAYGTPKKKALPKYVLKDVNIEVAKNDEFITIVGHTGSGKSTLVQLLNGLLLTDVGEVKVFGKKISKKENIKLKDIRKRVGLVFQFPEYQLFEETIIKDVSFGPKNFGLEHPEILAKDALKKVGIGEELFEESPFSLSGGQMRRVAIAGILASNPEVLIFDEPTVGLDPLGRRELLDLLKYLNEEYHKTIILITHDMDLVAEASKRVIVMDQGEVVYDGEKDKLFKNEGLLKAHSLDYPSSVRILKDLKKKLNLDIDEYQYTINDAYLELRKVIGG